MAEGKVVKLTFTQFRLEDGTSRGCGFDWLAVRDGDTRATEMGRFCGHDLPGDNGTIITTRNIATLEFRSAEITVTNMCMQLHQFVNNDFAQV